MSGQIVYMQQCYKCVAKLKIQNTTTAPEPEGATSREQLQMFMMNWY